jgi:hypothetical protein
LWPLSVTAATVTSPPAYSRLELSLPGHLDEGGKRRQADAAPRGTRSSSETRLEMWARISGTLILLLWSSTAATIDQIQLQWRTIESAGWRLNDINLEVDWSGSAGPEMILEVALVEIGDYHVEKLRVSCATLQLLPAQSEMRCSQGTLSFTSDWIDTESVPVTVNYRIGSRELTIAVSALPFAGGQVNLAFDQGRGEWRLKAELSDTLASGIGELLGSVGLAVPNIDFQGAISGDLSCRGDSEGVKNVAWDVRAGAFGYSNTEGTQAAEDLMLLSSGSARPGEQVWQLQATLTASQGVLYAEPIYLEFSQASPLELIADLHWDVGKRELLLRSLAFSQPDVVTGNLQAAWLASADKPLRQLSLEIQQAWLPGLFDTWLQPWLAGSVLEKLETAGRLRGELMLVDGRPQSVSMQLHQVSLSEPNGHFGLQAVDGDLRWDNSGASKQSSVSWQAANFHRLELGPAKLDLEANENSLRILHPLVVSLLDGQLHVDEFEMGVDGGDLRWLLDGMLTPVSMEAFSAALGWPPLSGKLSGMVPRVSYEKGELTLGGVLLVRAFDGDITVRNLRIQQPLGLVPRLWADARFEDIDLKTLTRTFSFGRIEGRLQGRIDDLYMEAWQLVAFDAAFQTPPDDGSRHRISQKAVDNISNLGGAGVGGAVSRSFLRFLEDFPYRRLGIRCRLENDICYMDGVAPAENGYYLVEGSLLPPRLDVIGYASQVDWSSLLGRLKAIIDGDGPVVQ